MSTSTFGFDLVFAVSAGLATFFAPCAFPLLPGYVGYYVARSETGSLGLVAAGAVASGALCSLGSIAAVVVLFGQRVTGLLSLFEPVIGAGLVVVGILTFLGHDPTIHIALPDRPDSLSGVAVFGAVYAVAAAGCVVPLFLGVVTRAVTLPISQTLAVLGVYALSVTAPLVGVTLLASVGVDSWREMGRYTGRMKQMAAVVMIAAGVGQLVLSVVVLDVL